MKTSRAVLWNSAVAISLPICFVVLRGIWAVKQPYVPAAVRAVDPIGPSWIGRSYDEFQAAFGAPSDNVGSGLRMLKHDYQGRVYLVWITNPKRFIDTWVESGKITGVRQLER